MKKLFYAIILMATTTYAQESENEQWTSNRPDGHAPITVMGDHMHNKGEVMFSYRYMYMNMEDLNRGSENVSFENALSQYMVTPTSMPMNMHMLGLMYAPSNKITLVAMANYLSNEMDHITRMGGMFTTESSGFGDLKIGALYKFFNKNKQQLHGQVGVSIPTGSIDQQDVIPASAPNEVILPYTTLRTGENDNEYRLGNKYSLTSWLAHNTAKWLSISGRVEVGAIDRIKGANPALNPMMVITADTANSGMTYANAAIGFNLYAFKGSLKNIRLGFEAALPLFQNMNGVQLRTKETLTFGLQYAL